MKKIIKTFVIAKLEIKSPGGVLVQENDVGTVDSELDDRVLVFFLK